MEIEKLVSDVEYIKSKLKVTADDRLVATRPCQICFPVRYLDANLATIGESVDVVGCFAFIMDGKYCTNKVLSKMSLDPNETETITYNDQDYYLMSFEPGATIVKNINLLVDDTIPYFIYNLFIAKGKVPWFMSYDDILTIFENTGKYNNVVLGANPSVVAMLGATIARSHLDSNIAFRNVIGQAGVKQTPFWVSLENIQFSADDTVSKLLGSYMDDGINSSLIYPSRNVSDLEEALRN